METYAGYGWILSMKHKSSNATYKTGSPEGIKELKRKSRKGRRKAGLS